MYEDEHAPLVPTCAEGGPYSIDLFWYPLPEYCVSSSANLLDDIIPCMVVGGNSSGSVAIEDGLIIVRAGDQEERYSLTDFQTPKDATNIDDTAPKFNMEPGK